jgi:hypothetical protein
MSLSKTWRLNTLIAAVMAGAFVLPAQLATAQPAAVPAPAGAEDTAAGPDQTIRMKVGISQQELADLRAQGRKAREQGHKSLPVPAPTTRPDRAAPAKPAKKAAEPLTVLEADRVSKQAAADNARQAARSPRAAADPIPTPEHHRGWVPIGEMPNEDRLNACFDGDAADKGIGRVYNRFTYCARWNLQVEYWEIDSKGVPVEKEGTTSAVWRVFGQGDAKDRRVRIFSQIEKDSVDYDWGPIDNIFVAPGVPLSLMGQCSQDSDVCGAGPGSYTMPWATWDNNPIWANWDIYNREQNTEGRDKISYNQWYVEAFTDNEEYTTLNKAETPPRLVRCDSATYFNKGKAKYPKACIFSEVTPHLTYTRGTTHHAVAEHLYIAFNQPRSTYPLLAPPGQPWPRDKKIPGKYDPANPDAPGLHRITKKLHPDETKANKDHKDGACFKTGPERDQYRDTGLPNGTNPGEQCDEYPFASTLEGAGNASWDFSVKSVPAKDNRVAGGMLREYYVDDRMLAWDKGLDRPSETNDRFYMKID